MTIDDFIRSKERLVLANIEDGGTINGKIALNKDGAIGHGKDSGIDE
jgi:hypothetical protein